MFSKIAISNPSDNFTARQRSRILYATFIGLLLSMSALSATLLLSKTHASGTQTITIDKDVQYQQIDGFGVHGNMFPDYFNETESQRWNADFLNLMVKDLGITVNREAINADFEKTKGTYDPTAVQTSADYVKALQDTAKSAQAPAVKVILSLWSPPAWMKQNGSVAGTDSATNRLKNDDQTRQDYADFLVNYIRAFKQKSGVEPFAVSLQNEPTLALNYISCYYTSDDLVQLLKVVGPRLEKEKLSTKIFFPEGVSILGSLAAFLNKAEQDPIARKYLNFFAVHGYSGNGVNPAADSAKFWKSTYALAAQYNIPVWMTETSGYATDWSGAMLLGTDMLTALRDGHLSGYSWWLVTNSDSQKEGLFDPGTKVTLRSSVAKQFYRYIRPGAVMVDANSSDPDMLVTAFKHVQDKTLTTVLINNSTIAKTFSFNFKGENIPAQFSAYRTSATENAVSVGTVKATDTITLPASSVTTLYGTSDKQDSTQAAKILQQPQSTTVSAGSSVTLSVKATGTPQMQYQWKRNGVAIDNAVGPLHTFMPTKDDSGASYTVTVKNAYGTVTSAAAKITVGAFMGAKSPSTATPIKVDGKGDDAIWSTAPSYPISHAVGAPNNIAGSFQTAWDDKNLYFLVKVNDQSYKTNDDNVEIYLDPDNVKTNYYTSNDWQLVYTQKTYAQDTYQGGSKANPPAFPTYGQGTTSTGYVQEIAIPWTALSSKATSDKFVGVEVDLSQGSSKSKLFWNGATDDAWHDPSTFGAIQLSKGAK